MPNWQDKALRKLNGLIHFDGFQTDINNLPTGDFEARFSALYKITEKYELPGSCIGILDHYAKTNELDPGKAFSKMSIICSQDKTAGPTDSFAHAHFDYIAQENFPQPGLHLFIPIGTSQIELKSFVQSHWPYIESKLTTLNHGEQTQRVRQKTKAKRDAEILRLHGQGLDANAIVEKISSDVRFKDESLIYTDIPQIVKRNVGI